MDQHPPPWTLEEIASYVGGVCDGPPALCIERPASADSGDGRGIAFAESAEYLEAARSSGVGAVIAPSDAPESGVPCVRVADPRRAFGILLSLAQRPLPLDSGVHATAQVDPLASVHATASIGAYSVVERGASILGGARVYPFCYVGEDCSVGEGCVLYPHVVLEAGAVVHSGAILGADGFGYAWDGAERVKIPQVGGVQVGKNAEIGANTAVDRATFGTTEVGEGTKIDNLVQIAHNVTIGKHGAIAAKSGVAGSTKLGDRVVLGGDVGIRDHVRIGDDVALGARSGVEADILEPGEYFGVPARPKREALRTMLTLTRLPELAQRIRELERRIQKIEDGGGS